MNEIVSKWWDRHSPSGNVLNLIAIVFLAGGAYFVVQERLNGYDTKIEKHAQRLTKIEDLQISMAEVVLQQNQFQNQLNRVEERMMERYRELSRRFESLSETVRERRQQ